MTAKSSRTRTTSSPGRGPIQPPGPSRAPARALAPRLFCVARPATARRLLLCATSERLRQAPPDARSGRGGGVTANDVLALAFQEKARAGAAFADTSAFWAPFGNSSTA